MTYPIIDLHCDLLAYLEENEKRTAYDPDVHCSIAQLKGGNVKVQTLAVFTKTGSESVSEGMKQLEIYRKLPSHYLKDFYFNPKLDGFEDKRINIPYAIENGSGFCDEKESLQSGLDRLSAFIKECGKPLYIGLTWSTENRFGGGNQSRVGLKNDGRYLLEYLSQYQIGVDFSHTSDALAYEILDYIDNKDLSLPVLASHSNARQIVDMPRNLPDEIAKEIFRRGGIIGLNFYKRFVGDSYEWFSDHIAHWLQLGGQKGICFGADFFYEGDFPNIEKDLGIKEPFFRECRDADCYGRLMEKIKGDLKLGEETCKGLAYENALNFFRDRQ